MGTAVLGLSMGAGAATVSYEITNGQMGEVEHSCTWITTVFTNQDCTYGNTTVGLNPLGTVWGGPTRQGGYYPVGSAGDSLTFNPNDSTPGSLPAEPDDFKIKPVVVGTVIIDDSDTPADGTDDTVRLVFSIQGPTPTAGIVRSFSTGQFTQALQRWQSLDHTMAAPYPVDQAIPNANGGFDYIIGSRGTPTKLCRALNPGGDDTFDPDDCFPSPNYDKDNAQPAQPAWWAPRPAIGSVGIERSPKLGIKPGPGPGAAPPGQEVPNIGIQTVAVFRDRVDGVNNAAYSCENNNQASDDCILSPLVWNTVEDPGFDNMVGIISTDANGITSAELYWTQEYFIGAFGAQPVDVPNSFQASLISFDGIRSTTDPTAVDDAFTVVAGTSNSTLDVLANDRNYPAPPETTVTITVAPSAGGNATVNGDGTINYTPVAASGVETFTYQATTVQNEIEFNNTAVVSVTIQPDTQPGGGPVALAINTQGRSGAAAAGNVTLTNLGNLPSTVTLTSTGDPAKGACTVSGATITYTPQAAFVNGGDTDSCNYSVTDLDEDNATGVVNVTITDVQPVLGDAAERELDAGDTTTSDAAFTAGNGTVAQHTLAVTTQATSGSCTASVVGGSVRVSYTSNDDASGADSCVVTLTDADGDSDTGTFAFSVLGGGVTLPGGGSAVDPWSLLLLGGLPLLARRRLR
jgi:hypothetical protein